MMENRVYVDDLETFADLILAFQTLGLAFKAEAQTGGRFYIDVMGY